MITPISIATVALNAVSVVHDLFCSAARFAASLLAALALCLASLAWGATEPDKTPENAVAAPPETARPAAMPAAEAATDSKSEAASNHSHSSPTPPDASSPGSDGQNPPSDASPHRTPAAEPDTPRSWFELYGLDESHFAKFVSGRPLDADEVEPLLKVIFRMRRFTPEQIAQWTQRKWSVEELAQKPQSHQSEMFRLVGQVIDVETVKPAEEVASLFEMPEYYRCRIELASGAKAEVYAASVPRAWLAGGGPFPARCEVSGVFLKTAAAKEEEKQPELVFAAARVAWHPPTPLGNLQFDYGLFDQVVDRAPPESEPFHEMLAAVRRSKRGELDRIAREQLKDLADRSPLKQPAAEGQGAIVRQASDGSWFYSVVPLFHDSEASRGRLVAFEGVARQVQKVVIDEPEIRQRYGIDHYYQVSLFTADSGVNPVIFCVLELPPDMPVGARDRYGEKIRVAGFMFKLWSYRIDIPRGADEDSKTGRMRQRAPLLVARDLLWYPAPPPPPRSSLAAVIGLGFLAAATLLGWWALRRSDHRDAKPRHAETVERFQWPAATEGSPLAALQAFDPNNPPEPRQADPQQAAPQPPTSNSDGQSDEKPGNG